MVFNEWYGEIPFTLNRTIKKYNVSPADYDNLRDQFGSDFTAIEAFIKENSESGMYQEPWPLVAPLNGAFNA